uniref:fatty acid oxidation complex subunit alpha FadJ n=1 Tax=Thaumasiovibrio occultus TaxID=1891184 RepID=UPI000B3598E7|nr:fatty acid oxidation complex subunit alpha FadJ [Thaumasiovibrio occultus]
MTIYSMETQPSTTSSAVARLSIDAQQIGWIEINVPNERMNTLQAAFVSEFEQLLDQLQAANVKGAVIYSGKPDNFIAGADIRMLDACTSAEQGEAIAKAGQDIFNRIEQLPFTVVAAIHGACLGGGLELALACHVRICSLDDKTRLGLPEVQLGLLPGSGGTQRLPALVGLPSALELLLSGKQLRAKQAKRMGLVNDAVPQSILHEQAAKLALGSQPKSSLSWRDRSLMWVGRHAIFAKAEKMAQAKARGNYPAIDAILSAVNAGLSDGRDVGLAQERQQFGRLVMTPESVALRHIFFRATALKKQTDSEKQLELQRVAVLGGGLMGGGISHVTAYKAALPVRLKDIDEQGIVNALKYNWDRLKKMKHLRLSQQQAVMSRISGDTQYRGFSQADIVVEAVFEDLNLKQTMVADIEAQCSEQTVFASNTSSLPIAQIAAKAERPENVVGLHYFSPVEKMPLVEVIPHQTTSDRAIAAARCLALKQGKTPIVVADKAGFFVNRILVPYMNEAAHALLAGYSIDTIDDALLAFGFPVGPIALLDEVGIDVGAKIIPVLVEAYGERFQPPALFETLLNDGRKGRKTAKGFYQYQGKKKSVDPQVYKLLGITLDKTLSPDDLGLRCTLMMLNEAARCFDEGVIANARDGDMGAIFGIGFPPFLGGPYHYMDTLGAAKVVELLEVYQRRYGNRFAPCERLQAMAQSQRTFYHNDSVREVGADDGSRPD